MLKSVELKGFGEALSVAMIFKYSRNCLLVKVNVIIRGDADDGRIN
jgi:hypothetical protein